MKLVSTADPTQTATFAEALDRGPAPDGGLYLPAEYPSVAEGLLDGSASFADVAAELSRGLLGDEIAPQALTAIVEDAFPFPVPVRRLDDRLSVLELFHGPTLAFKDIGARFMARAMAWFHRHDTREIVVLVATSGDTGGAVASGFAGVPGVQVVLLYPGGRVSTLQELQLTTGGENITALRVDGTFDDCQGLVKEAFRDPALRRGRTITSANSINIARLLPQSFYYVSAWGELRKEGSDIRFVVPSGNFGNLTAGLMARSMGVPAERFLAATNVNDVFAEYVATGVYRPRQARKTVSNAMDVGDPSNLARIRAMFNDDLEAMRSVIATASFTDEQTVAAGRDAFERHGYVFDPHGAVGYAAHRAIAGKDGRVRSVILGTAHPAKFPEFLDPARQAVAGIPEALRGLEKRPRRFRPISPAYEELRDILAAA